MSELPHGYRHTELGIVPADWRISELGLNCDFENGDRGENYPSAKSYVSDGVPFINAGHLKGKEVQEEELDYITPSHFERLRSGKVEVGDLLFCLRGSIGKYGKIGYHFGQGAIASSLIIVRVKPAKLDQGFLLNYFGSRACELMIKRWAGGAAQPNLGGKELERFQIVLPSLPEQQAIAKALGDVERLIAALEALIAKKRMIKQGAMQDLLTGHRRLPGFEGEWEVKRLGEIAEKPMQNGVFFQVERKGRGVPIINVGDLYGTAPISLSTLDLFEANQSEKDRFSVKDGDLFFTRSSVVPSGIAHCNIVRLLSNDAVVFDSHVIRYSPNYQFVDADFLYRACIGPTARSYLVSHAKTGSMTTIDQGVLAACLIALPKLKEQAAIAKVLSDMEAEITVLETKLAKTRDVKQGMMQVLLTGEVRLV